MLGPLAIAASLLITIGDPHGDVFAAREIEFPFQDELRLPPGEHGSAKLWRSHGLPSDGRAAPLVIFVHGIISDGQPHHWLTRSAGGAEDAREFVQALVDRGSVAPLVVAAPSQTLYPMDQQRLFVGLDLDDFVDGVDRQLAPFQRVDRSRVVVVGHSGALCAPEAGALAALKAKRFTLHALLYVDGCMGSSEARLIASTRVPRNLVVTYQDGDWTYRQFDAFRATWDLVTAAIPPHGVRSLERYDLVGEGAHVEMVSETVRRWLPTLLPPTDGASWTASLPRAFE